MFYLRKGNNILKFIKKEALRESLLQWEADLKQIKR